jgi:tetratricopeptide (TPR) repeat protein
MKAMVKVTALLVGVGLAAAARAEDQVKYLDPSTKKEVQINGQIQEETPAGIRIKPARGPARRVPSLSIVDIEYELGGKARIAYKKAAFAERTIETAPREQDRKQAMTEALEDYQQVRGEANARVKRHLDYRIARLLALQAEGDPSKAPDAVDQLTRFCKDHADGWQLPHALRLLGQLQALRHKYDAAAKAYEQLAAIPDLSPEARQEGELKAADMMVQDGKYAGARKKLDGLARAVPADDPRHTRLEIALAACRGAEHELAPAVQGLEAILAKSTDNAIKAAAYNALGDCYRENSKPEEARWAYLYVDVIYHQDREEHAKAVYWLAKIFKQLGDDKKAGQYRERLQKEKRFAGLEYQRLLAAEQTGGAAGAE